DRIGEVVDAGADIIVGAGWRNARLARLQRQTDRSAHCGAQRNEAWTDRSADLNRAQSGASSPLRLVAVKKLTQAGEGARRKARREAVKADIKSQRARSSLRNGPFS